MINCVYPPLALQFTLCQSGLTSLDWKDWKETNLEDIDCVHSKLSQHLQVSIKCGRGVEARALRVRLTRMFPVKATQYLKRGGFQRERSLKSIFSPEKDRACIWGCKSSHSAPAKSRQVASLDKQEEDEDGEEGGAEQELGGDGVPGVAELDGGVVAGEAAPYGGHQPPVQDGEAGGEHCKGGEEGHGVQGEGGGVQKKVSIFGI